MQKSHRFKELQLILLVFHDFAIYAWNFRYIAYPDMVKYNKIHGCV